MANRVTLALAAEALQTGVEERTGLHDFVARRMAELAPKAAEMLREVGEMAAKAVALQHEDDLDPAFAAAEAALNALWDAMRIIGVQKLDSATDRVPTARDRKPKAKPATPRKATAER